MYVEKKTYKFRTCNICGCKQYSTNFARHVRTKKHKEADYADNKFEVEKYEPLQKKEYRLFEGNFIKSEF